MLQRLKLPDVLLMVTSRFLFLKRNSFENVDQILHLTTFYSNDCSVSLFAINRIIRTLYDFGPERDFVTRSLSKATQQNKDV